MYFWVVKMHQGKPVIFHPPYTLEEDANQYGFSHFGGDFEVYPTTVRNRADATRAIKRAIFEKTHNLDLALQRAKHKLPNEKEVT